MNLSLEASHVGEESRAAPAKEDGVSLNRWIAVAVVEKIGTVETAAAFFQRRAGKASGARMMKFLRKAPRVCANAEDAVRQHEQR